jgi:hypothetical protein
MPGDWNDRLRKLLVLANAAREHPQEELRRPVNQRPIAINLGIDFGTSFTKVCFRDVGAEHSPALSSFFDAIRAHWSARSYGVARQREGSRKNGIGGMRHDAR